MYMIMYDDIDVSSRMDDVAHAHGPDVARRESIVAALQSPHVLTTSERVQCSPEIL